MNQNNTIEVEVVKCSNCKGLIDVPKGLDVLDCRARPKAEIT